jgi:hypothetical protein
VSEQNIWLVELFGLSGRTLFKLVGNTDYGTLLPAGTSLLNGINVFNFKYENDFKMENKYFADFRDFTEYLSTKTIKRPPQSDKTIPLSDNKSYELFRDRYEALVGRVLLGCATPLVEQWFGQPGLSDKNHHELFRDGYKALVGRESCWGVLHP